MSEKYLRLQEYEALRSLSIIMLLALHSEVFAPQFFGERLGSILGTFVATSLLGSFFFLAGYFTEVSISKSTGGILHFAWSKFIRIFPPYWLALFLFITVLGYSLKRMDLAVYILNVQSVFSPTYVKPLLTLWYISMLVVFYILYGTLMFIARSNWQLMAGSVLIFVCAYLANLKWGLFDPRFFQYFFMFLSGIYFCRFETARKSLFDLNIFLKFAFIILSIWIFQRILVSDVPPTSASYIFAADLFILSWILLWLSLFRTAVGRWPVWAWLSAASFFTYLIHRPLWRAMDFMLGIEEGVGRVWLNLTMGMVLTLIFGWVLQRGYNRLLTVLRLK